MNKTQVVAATRIHVHNLVDRERHRSWAQVQATLEIQRYLSTSKSAVSQDSPKGRQLVPQTVNANGRHVTRVSRDGQTT